MGYKMLDPDECDHEVTEWSEDDETLEAVEVCLDCDAVLSFYNPIPKDTDPATWYGDEGEFV